MALTRAGGWALRAVSAESRVPWQRVLNAAGCISLSNPRSAAEQRRLLEAEGIVFDGQRVDLDRYGWEGLAWPEIQELLAQAEQKNEQT